jgi:ATP-binding cassette subfamily B protein
MEKPVLLDLELDIPAGSIVGLLGRTGSGKSTLVNLLPRLLDPPPGAVFVDGHDVREYDLASLRSAIRVVPQDTFLFSTSIRENIAFGAEDADADLLERAAAISTIRRDLGNFPQGWETVVGERGITLSGGQKQRVALSRAIAAQAAIYILDDAMSSVDTETEEAILSALLPRLRGSTVILVSHRVSTLRNTDRVVVLEGGRITQEGTPAQLAAIPGFYADILRLQQLEESLKGHR